MKDTETEIKLIKRVLENNQIVISQLSYDFGELRKNIDVKLTLLNFDLADLRKRLKLLEDELESLFKK